MAGASKDRTRIYRERLENDRKKLPDSTYGFLAEPFHEWLARNESQGDWGSGNQHLDAAGLDDIEIVDDLGPRSRSGELEKMKSESYDPYAGFSRSIGQAEAAVVNLIAAAHCMATVISRYKLEQIRLQIDKIEKSNLTAPEARKNALADIVRLSKIRDHLEKQSKINFPQWQVKGM